MSSPPPIRIVLWNDGGEGLAAGVEDEEQQEVLRTFANLVAEAIESVLELPQFRHVEAVQVDAAEGAPSSLSIGFDVGASGAEVSLDKLQGQLDIAGLLLGSAGLPAELAAVAKAVVQDDEQGVVELQLSDPALDKQLSALLRRARLERLYEDWYARVEPALGPALDAASANVEASETPLDPLDVVRAVVAQLMQVAGVCPPRPSLLRRGQQLVGRVLGSPGAALRQVTRRLGRAQRLWWRLEDVVVDGSRLAAKVALRAARPVLIGVVLHRVLRTLDASRSLEARLSRMSPSEAEEHYCSSVLGRDWREQIQADWDKAQEDVAEGLVTDEINQEKRLMTAAQIRRMEVEDWDKQRMKNFYLASFGGLRWFDQMEQALHNPLFIESRGWTDPVENWVGLNRTYMADLPSAGHMADVGPAALALKEAELGRRLSSSERARVLAAGAEVAGGLLPTSNKEPAAAALAAGGALIPRA